MEETRSLGSKHQVGEFPRKCVGRERKAARDGKGGKREALQRVGTACAKAQRHRTAGYAEEVTAHGRNDQCLIVSGSPFFPEHMKDYMSHLLCGDVVPQGSLHE